MFNALTANNYAGEPRFRVFPDDDRLKYTQLRNVQYHPFLNRQVYPLIIKWVGLIGDQVQVFRLEIEHVCFAAGTVYID
ncbi:hypothetical protein KLPN111865_25850 [Klebsiella pneumoniae]